MGVTKKPAVVAKTASKKRGRPVGSKNKSTAGAKLAALGGKAPVDWEKLAKQLQAALAAEMKEHEALEAIVADFKAVVRLDSSFTFWDRLAFLFSGKL